LNVHSAIHRDSSIPQKVIVGVAVASLRWDDAVAVLQHRIFRRQFTKVGFLNAHISNIACSDRRLMTAMADFLVLPDGVGVDVAAKVLYAEPFPANLNGTDFIPALLKATDRPLSVGLIGAKRANVEQAAATLRRMAPQHGFHVVSDGFFSPLDEPKVLADLEALKPDLLLVALGAPKQEFFIADKITEDHATMPFAVGALFDFLAHAVPRAPAWVRKLRMEWLFRLAIEPGRLWRRYILGNPIFLFHVFWQKLTGAWSSV
jgi:exopolysaccharide biosynthesis WecB/TagA/CpsF family protein